MSNVQQNLDPATTPSPAPHSDAAQLLIDQIRSMREQIPNFSFPTSPKVGQALNRAASVPQPFVELTAVAVKNSPALVRGGAADPARLRDLLTFATAYAPFADELEALASFVRHTVTAAKNEAGSTALTTYALAQRLAKRPETADLAPHVDDMRRALGRLGRKAKAKAEPQPTPETPVPTNTSPKTSPSPASPS